MYRSPSFAHRPARLKVVFMSLAAGVIATLILAKARVAEPHQVAAATEPPPQQQQDNLVPDHMAPPCRLQTWPNMDRACLSWTAPLGLSRVAAIDSGVITRRPESIS